MVQAAALPGIRPVPVAIPVREWLPWALYFGVALLFLVYIVGAEQGALSLAKGTFLHEWVHDARHLLGFPCH